MICFYLGREIYILGVGQHSYIEKDCQNDKNHLALPTTQTQNFNRDKLNQNPELNRIMKFTHKIQKHKNKSLSL